MRGAGRDRVRGGRERGAKAGLISIQVEFATMHLEGHVWSVQTLIRFALRLAMVLLAQS